ncbi:hypothetical protein [Rhizobium indicum]|uniref:Uncharacterized protein n=1 Tax=Rhizobium indicum TaxID=2583231 RepID=A0ABX6PPB9_9HYPH|nr:hypothetical protein [Rhizobium indicum]QKK20495.1 hypothetical protein FFM53_029410 [Rhizobium indicum]
MQTTGRSIRLSSCHSQLDIALTCSEACGEVAGKPPSTAAVRDITQAVRISGGFIGAAKTFVSMSVVVEVSEL